MTLGEARSCSHSGDCEPDVRALLAEPHIKSQLDAYPNAAFAAELHEYGAWSEEELKDREANELRILWLAACDISEEATERGE
jgi:hypothetical protein